MRGGVGVARASVLVGRETELEQLLLAVRRAAAGTSSCLFVVGEGGIGKTRLLSEAAAAGRRQGLGVLTGRGPITSPVAFSVLAEALRSWTRGHPPPLTTTPFDRGLGLVLPEWPRPAEGADLSPAQLRLLALEGIVEVVRRIATAQDGAVVVLDDLHAADPESLEAVRYLASAGVAGTAVIVALRANELALADELMRSLHSDGVAEVIHLSPLDERAVGELVAAILDADPPPSLVTDIVARTDGVPLLVEEVIDAHLRTGSVSVDEHGPTWRGGGSSVPRTIRELVEARLERLGRAQREVVVAGAVVGDFEPWLMAAVVGASAVEPEVGVAEALADGIRVGLLETTGGVIAFRHAIIREAVLDASVPHLLDTMHRRAAEALKACADGDASALERRARHLTALHADGEAASALTAAAEVRLGEHALLAAERLANAALALAPGPDMRAAAADTLARSLTAQGRWSEALDLDAATVVGHGETPERRYRMAISALEAGRPEMARPIIARAIASGDASAFIHVAAGRAALIEGDALSAVECAERALDGAAIGGDLDARLAALELQGRALDFLGRRDEAEAAWTRQATEAAAGGRTQGQLRAVVQLGKVELFAGRPPQRLFEAVELARRAGALVELAWAEENLSIGLALNGDIAAAKAVLDEAIPRCRGLRLDQLAYLLATRAMLDSYDCESVEDRLAEAEALAPTPDLLLHTAGMRCDISLRSGDYAAAIHWSRVANDLARAMPGAVPTDSPCWLVWALAAAGRPDEAAVALDEARALPDLERWHGRPVVVAAAASALAGDEAGVDDAVAGATGAMSIDIALMRVLGAQIIKGPARIRWLREALATYEAIGASLEADRVRGLLRQAGGPVPRRRRTTGRMPDELSKAGVTAREAEVLRLLGDGLTNADIADRLYLSIRTVESHVSALLAKLDARNRGQLTALSASISHDR